MIDAIHEYVVRPGLHAAFVELFLDLMLGQFILLYGAKPLREIKGLRLVEQGSLADPALIGGKLGQLVGRPREVILVVEDLVLVIFILLLDEFSPFILPLIEYSYLRLLIDLGFLLNRLQLLLL